MIHHRELKRTTNTGTLALQVLQNSQLLVRGLAGGRTEFSQILDPKYQSLLLYPSDDAQDLRSIIANGDGRPIHLLVPDGNWRQASKVHIRHPEFKNLVRVMVKAPSESDQFLRKESKANGLATLQAIALAMGCLEGAEIGEMLMSLYELKLSRTLAGRA